jgi:hypothetical protein
MVVFVKKKSALTFYQVSRVAAAELTPRLTVIDVLMVNIYYRERNALATFCHCRTKRQRFARLGLDLPEIHRCKWI